MTNKITILADTDIVEALERCLEDSYPSFSIVHKADSYEDCLEPSIQKKADIFVFEAKSPVTQLDDLLFDLQCAGISPIYVVYQITQTGGLRYATTSHANPLASKMNEIFQCAIEGKYDYERISIRSTLLNDDILLNTQTAGRHESLLEILRGCNQQEFSLYRETYKLNLKDDGYYLYFWELMDVEFGDHQSNKYIYNFSGELLLQECYEIINDYNGGEVFYSTPNLLCIILNDLDIKSETLKKNKFKETINQLAICTGNKVASRYLSERVDHVQGLRKAYEQYHSDKSLSFFLRDTCIIQPKLIEGRKRSTEIRTVNRLIHEITECMRYDMLNPLLEEKLRVLYFDILKPAMSFTLYYSSSAAIYNAIAEVRYSFEATAPSVNNNPNLLQFSSVEEQYRILMGCIRELGLQLKSVGRGGSALVLKAVNYIADHYTREITLSEISNALYVSNVHLSQVFKREMGVSIIKYLINYRMEQAKNLLRETDEYIYEISASVGYREFRHFSKTFKEITGLSPTQYRKKYR